MKSAVIVIVASLILLAGGCMDSPTEQAKKENTQVSGNADVLFVKAKGNPDGSWNFDVTVSHPDTGWDDYADGWDLVLPDGTIIKPDSTAKFTRTLLHPHVN